MQYKAVARSADRRLAGVIPLRVLHVHSPGKIRHPVGDNANPTDTVNYHLAFLKHIRITAIVSAFCLL